jgi:hypothetical protein
MDVLAEQLTKTNSALTLAQEKIVTTFGAIGNSLDRKTAVNGISKSQ